VTNGDIITNFYPYYVSRWGDNVGTPFGRVAPKIFDGPKMVQNFARFLTTFDFDRQYLRNGSTNRKSKSTWSTTTPSTLG